jgi:hypothetical protein
MRASGLRISGSSSHSVDRPESQPDMFNETNDSFLLYLNSKAVAIGPDFDLMARLGETVSMDRPDAALTIRVADRLSAARQPAVNGEARSWAFDRAAWTWHEL